MQYRSRNNARTSIRVLKPAVLAVALGCTAQAGAVEGGAIVAGNGGIATQGRNTVVSQASDRMVVNWKSFDIARNQSVEFRQPGTGSAVLNRVTSTSPTQILGALKANGQVFVVNPQGVMFGRTAKVDVGSLVASALDTSAGEFMVGGVQFPANAAPGWEGNLPRYVMLEGDSTGSVRNEGTITAREGVILAGPKVSNQGTIRARDVALQAGDGVGLRIAGSDFYVTPTYGRLDALAENGGTIVATGGNINLSAAAVGTLLGDVVRNTGRLEASHVNYVGGQIELTAPMDGAISIGGKVTGERVMANTVPFDMTDTPFPTPVYTSELAKSGHDIRVEPGARIAGKQAVMFVAQKGNIEAGGRVEAGIVGMRGANVALQGPVRATYDVNVRASGDVSQTADITAEQGHVDMEGRNIVQASGTRTRAGNYISLTTPDQPSIYEKDGVVVTLPPYTYNEGRIQAANLEADSVAIVSHRVDLGGNIKSRGDVQLIGKDKKFVCLAGANETCIALDRTLGQINQRGNVTSTEGSIRYDAAVIEQQPGTRTRAAHEVLMKAGHVYAASIQAGDRVAIDAKWGATLKGKITAPKVELPANVTYEGGSVRAE